MRSRRFMQLWTRMPPERKLRRGFKAHRFIYEFPADFVQGLAMPGWGRVSDPPRPRRFEPRLTGNLPRQRGSSGSKTRTRTGRLFQPDIELPQRQRALLPVTLLAVADFVI